MRPACAPSTTVGVHELLSPVRDWVRQPGCALNVFVVGTAGNVRTVPRFSSDEANWRQDLILGNGRWRSGEESKYFDRRLGGMGASCSGQSASVPDASASREQEDFRSITDEEWRKRLTKEQYKVARQKGTERAFTGEYWNTKTSGTYHCVCCNTALFESSTKFDSGTGWPSYWEYVSSNVKEESDWSIPFMPRTEVTCAVCDSHLGHVFNDGPPPTKKRYCINSASLNLRRNEA